MRSASEANDNGPSTLYIADLDVLVNEAHIQAAFGGSPVRSVRVVRDTLSGRCLGHAYVNFESHADAKAALEQNSPLFVGSSMCRAFLFPGRGQFEKPPRIQGEGIFIKNLPPETTVKDLYDVFKKFGTIIGCRIATTPFGMPRGFAYVSFDSKQAVSDSISQMNGAEFGGRRLYVGHNLPRRERIHKYDESKPDYTNLFVKGIGSATREQEFFDFFSAIGPIDSYSMPLDEFGSPRGFGFVNYKSHNDAVEAVQKLDGARLSGRVIRVSRAQQRETSSGSSNPQSSGGSNLYIKNLDLKVDDDSLSKEFSQFGQVISAKVMMDEQGISRGFGFVCFQDSNSADHAIAAMHGRNVWGNNLYVALAQRRDRRSGPWNSRGTPIMPQAPIMMPQPMMNMGYVPMMMPMPMPVPTYYYYDQQQPIVYPREGSSPGLDTRSSTPATSIPPYHPPQQPTQHRTSRRQQDYGSSLAAAVASAADTRAEKEVIGEALYPKVLKHEVVGKDDALASQLTGILLEQNKNDLMDWVDNEDVLNKRIHQAYDAYNKWANQNLNTK